MSITVYSFLLVLLFAISNTIPIFNSIHTFPRLPLHISLSCPRIFSCLADGASSSCLVLSYIFTPPSSLPLFPSSHSDLFRLHLPHRWMTHLVQTPLFPCLADFAHRDLIPPIRSWVFLKTGCPFSSPHPPPSPAAHSPIFASNSCLDHNHTPRNVCLHLSTRRISQYT